MKTAALLSTAFTFPYAIMQPALGTIGDFFGKTRLMNICLGVVVTTTLICAFASNFTLLVTMRIVAGVFAGGIFPIGMALVGDLVPIESRQVAIGRLLAVGLTGNLLGAVISGGIGDLLGWRGVFFSIGGFGLLTAVLAFFAFRGLDVGKPRAFNAAAAIAGFRGVFADPRAKICFRLGVLRGCIVYSRHVPAMHRGASARGWADTIVLCRSRDRRLRPWRHYLFAVIAGSGPAHDRASACLFWTGAARRRGLFSS